MDFDKGSLVNQALAHCQEGSDLDKIEAATVLMEAAVMIFNQVDELSADRQREKERERSLNTLAKWAQARGMQGAIQNEMRKWEADSAGNYQRLKTAVDIWKEDYPMAKKIRQLVEKILCT